MNPVYCSIYGDVYSWRLGRIEYNDPDNITIMVTADSIKRSAYNTALEILKNNIEKLHAVAGVLLEKEKIDGDEFVAIFR